ncbi:uncharacterized protein EV154DRAFT_480797 [Mucor mucedo]|uniref:uncharacterized protein n=1 Tax=Mucor mucedo TaxID=29922 RepID=UPI00221F3A2A|nr:uncharacterized protein EV154DRAFT_480797 [Mucor mucedo]KAI7891999.1 hypothetical protein EV154DRAFT_480797 [Mucor mucedo]
MRKKPATLGGKNTQHVAKTRNIGWYNFGVLPPEVVILLQFRNIRCPPLCKVAYENVSTETETYEGKSKDCDHEHKIVLSAEETQVMLVDDKFQDQNMDHEEKCLTQEKKMR